MWFRTATDLAAAIRAHEVTPREVVAGFLERTQAKVVVGTMSHDERPFDDPRLSELGAQIVDVSRDLSEAELDRARRLYPSESEAMAETGIPRAFDTSDGGGADGMPR